MKNLIRLLAISIFVSSIASCSGDSYSNPSPNPNPNPFPGASTTTFKATLNGPNEVPINSSSATGNATLTLNNTTKMFTITGTYKGITTSVTGAHIHKGTTTEAGPIIFPLAFNPDSAYPTTGTISYTSTVALDANQEADLMANLNYVNIHTSAYSTGEIRGQLIKQ